MAQTPVAELETLYKFKEAMGYLRVSRSTLWRLMLNGTIIGQKVGNTWRFRKENLDAAMQPRPVQLAEQGEVAHE